MSTELATIDFNQLPTQRGSDEALDQMTKVTTYLKRLQLYTKGNAVNRRLVGPGEFGIPESKDEITCLGDSVDLLVLARRAKAMDLSDKEAIITSYDSDSELFKEIQKRAAVSNSSCMFGPSFLVIERSTGQFLEFFCGSKSMRKEAGTMYPFAPLSQSEIDARAARGVDVSNLKAHGPLAMTLKSRLVEVKDFSWHVPVVIPCSTPFLKLPTTEKIVEEIGKFINPEDSGPEKVAKSEAPNRRAR